MKIGGKLIDGSRRAFVIAEVAQAHDGSLGMAHAFIDAAASAGADAVKFQTHIADAESTLDEQFRAPMSGQDATRWHYWKRMEFSQEQWVGLAEHARQCNLVFLSSPFSIAAVELLAGIGMPAWKVGSGEVFNDHLLRAMASAGGPILLSSGMSAYSDIERAVAAVRALGAEFALFQCASRYPTPLEQVGINVLGELRIRFGCPVGLSDHSGTPYPALAALGQSVDLIEVHVVFDRGMYGPDAKSSLTFAELTELTAANRAFATMRRHPVDKDVAAAELGDMRRLFSKSVAPVADLAAGTILVEGMLTVKKPGTGISQDCLPELVGRRIRRAVSADRLLAWDDLDAN
jgi:N,N'-diacetyllegionaminate synthase